MNNSGILSMYMEPPGADLTIEDFERFAIDRLRGDLPVCHMQHTDILSAASRKQASYRLNLVDTVGTRAVLIPHPQAAS